MPHQFKASPDHPAVDYLVRLHADLGGKIWENKKEAERLAESMQHVEAVIRLFDPSFQIKRISKSTVSRRKLRPASRIS